MGDEHERAEPWVVPDLGAESFEQVADRLGASTTFEELVYRESEMDALFTLADLALKEEERAGGGLEEHLRSLRALVFRAHDLSHDDRNEEAVAVLREAARLARALEEGQA